MSIISGIFYRGCLVKGGTSEVMFMKKVSIIVVSKIDYIYYLGFLLYWLSFIRNVYFWGVYDKRCLLYGCLF